jgi:hypothetical protein
VEEDLAVAVAEIMPEQVATEAATAWEVEDSVEAAAAPE